MTLYAEVMPRDQQELLPRIGPIASTQSFYLGGGPILEWSEYRCSLASLEDLACMKLSALASRGARKDFIDLYALGRSQFSLGEMLALYQEKYQTRDTAHVIYSLTYFDDAEREDMPEMLWELKWADVKRTIEGWVRDLSRRQAPPVP